MFERFTEQAVKAVVLALEESRRSGHNYIGTEQILIGLIKEEKGIAARVLKLQGVTLKDACREVEKINCPGVYLFSVDIPFTVRCKKVLRLALEEAKKLEKYHINTEHLLLGLISEGESVAVKVLKKLDVDLSQIHGQVMHLVSENYCKSSLDSSEKNTFSGVGLAVVPPSNKIQHKVNRLTAILTEAKKLIADIENHMTYKISVSLEDVLNVIANLPNSTSTHFPNIKELLIELTAAIESETDLNPEDKAEALEQVLVLAVAAHNQTKNRTREFTKKALIALHSTVADLPISNPLVEKINHILPDIAIFFELN